MRTALDSELFHGFLILGAICMSVAIIVIGKPILAPLALACVVAFVLTPVVHMLERWHIARGVAVLATMSMVVIGSLLLASGLIMQLRQLADDLPRHARETESKLQGLRDMSGTVLERPWAVVDRFLERLEGSDGLTADDARGLDGPGLDQRDRPVVIVRDPPTSRAMQWVPRVAVQLIEPVAVVSLVTVLAGFILLRKEDLRNRVLAIVGKTRLSDSTHVLEDGSRRLARYLLGLLIVNFGFSAAFTIILLILGVPYAALWGSVSFFFRFVPLIGSAVSMLLPLGMAIVTVPGWLAPLGVIAAYLSLEGITGNLIEPWLFGKSVGMNPLAILIAWMFWTWAWGLIGLALSTPLSLILVTLGSNISFLSWAHVLLGDTHPLPTYVSFYQRLLARDRREVEAIMITMSRDRGTIETMQRLVLAALRRADHEKRSGAISDDIYACIVNESEWAAERLVELTVAASSKSASDTDKTITEDGVSPVSEPQPETASNERFRIATIDFDVPRAAAATRVLMANQEHLDVTRMANWNAATLRRWGTEAPNAIFVSIVSIDKRDEAIALARLLRKRGYDGWLVLGWWRTKSPLRSTRRQLKEAGFDYVTHQMKSMDRMLRYAVESTSIAGSEPSDAA
jgi:predicted PurR-regulated permease PerM